MDALARAGRRGHRSLAAAVVEDGATRFGAWAASGPAPDERTLFEIGSITKAFTGVLLADMHLRGELALDDRLSRHLPDPGPRWGAHEPTLLDLATHRSGLPNSPRGMARRELEFVLGLSREDPWKGVDAPGYRKLLRGTSTRPPREGRLRYSSVGFGLLGEALAAAAGKSYEDLLRERVLAPLGMSDTGTASDPLIQGHSRRGRPRPPIADPMPAAGVLRSDAADMATFLSACLAPGPEPPGPALALAQRPVRPVGRDMSIGLGWLVYTRKDEPPVVWHNGGTWGFASVAGFCPERRSAAVVLANTMRPVDRLGLELLDGARPRPADDGSGR